MASQQKKILISLMSALVFFVVANPETFRFMRRYVGSWVASATGCPTHKGLFLHTVVFMLVVYALMYDRSEKADPVDPIDKAVERVNDMAVPEPMKVNDSPRPMKPTAMQQKMIETASTPQPDMSKVLGNEDPGLKSGRYAECSCSDGTEFMMLK